MVGSCDHGVEEEILGLGQGPPSPSTSPKTMEIIMFSMILGVEQVPLSAPTSPTNYGNHYVFNDFSACAGAPVTSTSPKSYENRNVYHDFGGWAGAPIISHLPRKVWKSSFQ